MLKAPFPYCGGKSRVAAEVWSRFGQVNNYIEPFCGSMAMLLSRPKPNGSETVNDIDGLLTNFWRALRDNPVGLAELAKCPPSEIECTARHNWVYRKKERILELQEDPEAYDLMAAAFWVYVRSTSVGSRGLFCEHRGLRVPLLGSGGQGVHNKEGANLLSRFTEVADRIRHVRICCGDWKRVLTNSPLRTAGLPAAIFLDPPYQDGEWDNGVYEFGQGVFNDVREWGIANSNDPQLRIALCGYDGVSMPDDWSEYAWIAQGGMANVGKKENSRSKANRSRERIWFSPHCLSENQGRLF